MTFWNALRRWTYFVVAGCSASERAYADECSRRSRLTDDEFIERFYSSSDVRRDVPLRVRQVLAEQLRFDKVLPSDCPCDIDQDLDLQEILYEIGEEFGVALEAEELPANDWSVDSIVRLVNSKVNRGSGETRDGGA